MKNSLEFTSFELSSNNTTFNITNYNSMCLNKIKIYLQNIDKANLLYLKVDNDAKIEKICLDYYGNTDYYDLLLIINQREMVFDMAYSNDIILSAIESDIENYRNKVFKDPYKDFSVLSKNNLTNVLYKEYEEKNSKLKYIKVINADYISTVITDINKIIATYQDNITLLDL